MTMNYFIEDKGFNVLSGDDGYLCVHTIKKTDLSNVIDDVVGSIRFLKYQDAKLCAIMCSEDVPVIDVIVMFDAFYHRKFTHLTPLELMAIIGERL